MGSAARFRLALALLAALAAAGCSCEVPKFSCSNDAQCPATYSCVSGLCEPCPACGEGERCSAGACVPAVDERRLVFTSAPQTVAAGACSGEVQFEAQDLLGAAAAAGADLPVALAATSGSLAFFLDPACGSPLTSVLLPAGASGGGFYFKDSALGAPELTLSAAGHRPARQQEAIVAGPPARLVLTTAPQTVAAGACSAEVALQAQDSNGNPSPVAADVAVALSASSATLAFFADPGCSAGVGAVTLSAGATRRSFYFRDTAVGATQLTATAPFGAASQPATIVAGAAAALAFTTPSRTIAAGACSAVLTVQAQDALANPAVAASAVQVALGSTAATTVFHADPACTSPTTSISIAPGGSAASFYFTDTAAGVPALTAASAGLASANQSQAVTASLAVAIAFTSAPQSITSGDCSAEVRIQARDGSGNPAPVPAAEPLALFGGGTMVFYSDANCTSPVTSATIALAATSTAFYFRDTGTGARTISVTSATLGGASQNQTITAVVGRLAFTTGAQTRAAGACSGVVTVQTQTSGGAPQSVPLALPVSLSSSSSTLAFFSDSGCTAGISTVTVPASGTAADFYFRDTATGTPTLTANASGYSQAVQQATIAAGAATKLAYTTAPQSRPAGACSAPVTVQTRDAFDNPSAVVGITPLSLGASSASLAFFSDPACTAPISGLILAAGASQASFHFKDTAAGSPTVTVGGTGLGTVDQVETITAGAASALAFVTAAQSLVAGACSALATVQSRDGFGNAAAPAAAIAIGLGSSSGTTSFYSDAACTTPATGTTIAAGASTAGFYFKDTRAGTATVTASTTTLGSVDQTEAFTAGPPSKLAITSAPQTVADSSCSAAVNVQTQDQNGNASSVAADAVVLLSSSSGTMGFYSDAACSVPATQVTVAAGGTQAAFFFRDTAAGAPTLTAASAPLTAATQQETITLVAKRLAFTTAAQNLVAGSCSGIVTLQSQDTGGAALPVTVATTVTVNGSIGATQLFSDNACTTPLAQVVISVAASATSFYFKNTTAGSLVLTASSPGYAGAAQTQTQTPGPVAAFGFATPPATVPVNTCSLAVSIWPVDQYGNNLRTNNTVTVSTSSGTMGLYSNSGCTSALGPLNFTNGTVSRSFYFKDTVTGSPVLTLTASGLANGTQTESVTPGPPARLVFTTAAQNVVAGACSLVATVGLQDAFTNPAPAAAPTTVNLASTPGSLTFYSNPGCTTPVANVVIAAGSSAGSFYFRDSAAGGRTINATSNGLAPTSQGATIVPAPASKVVFVTNPQSRTAGDCSGVTSIQTQDPFNNPSDVTGSTVAALTGSTGSLVLYSDSGCATAIGSVTFAPGTNLRSFHFKETLAGTTIITATAGGLAPGSQPETIVPGPASRVAFTSAPQTVLESVCSAVASLQTQDGFGNASPVGAPNDISLTSSSATMAFFSDASCATASSFLTIAGGASAGAFYFRDTTVGTPSAIATSATLGSATQFEIINPAVPTKLVVITPARTVAAGACSPAVTLQSQNNNSVASVVTADTTATLTSTAGTTFYSDAACATAVTSVTLTAGTSQQSFYFRDTAVGTPTLTATPPVLAPASQAQVIQPAAAASLHFTNAPITATAGVCSSAAALQVRDAFGNNTTVSTNTVVTLSALPPTLTFFTDSGCTAAVGQVTIAAGSGTQGFYFRADLAGATTATADASGLAPASQGEQVNPAGPTVLALTSAPQTLAAGSCSGAVTLRTRDSFGNDSNVGAPTAVGLAGGASMTFFGDAACGSAVTQVTVPSGTSTATFYFRDDVAGGKTISATAGGYTPGSQPATINPAAPTRLVFTTAAQVRAAGECSGLVSLQTRDPYGNASNVAAPTVTSLTPSTGTLTFYSDPGCANAIGSVTFAAGSNLASFYFKGTQVGGPTVTASAGGLASAVQTETITAAAADKLVFTNAPITVGTGVCSSAATLRVRDAFDNDATVAGATTVNLSSNPATLTFYTDAACSSSTTSVLIPAGGGTQSFFFKTNTAGNPVVTAAGGTLDPAVQAETVSSGGPLVLAFTTAPQAVTAGACSGVATVQTRDAFNNPSAVASPLTVDLAGPTMTFYSGPGCSGAVTSVVVGAGTNSQSFYFRATGAGPRAITASSAGFSSAVQTQTVNPAAAFALAFTNPPLAVTAGACSPAATLQVRDSYGNDTTVAGSTAVGLSSSPPTLSWFSDSGCSTAAPSVTIAAGTGTQTAYFRATVAGSPTAIATSAPLNQATQLEQVNPAPATVLAFLTGPQTVTAGTCSGAATVQTRDVHGNASSVGTNTSVALGAATMTFYADAACSSPLGSVTVLAGANTATFYFKDDVAGGRAISATSAGFSPANQTETVRPASPAKVVFTTTAQTLLASACSAAATVETRDALENPTTAGAAVALSVGATPADAAVSFYSDAACATPASGLTIPAGSSAGTFYFRGRTGGTATLTATVSGLAPASQGQTLRATVRAGTCSIGAGNSASSNCAIAPPLFNTDRTMLFFGASTTGAAGDEANVRCVLSGLGSIACDRAGTTSSVSIQWHTVEFPAGAAFPRVRHISQPCSGATTTATISPALGSTANSFVLLSATRSGSNGQTVASSRTAKITAVNQVAVAFNSGGCGGDQYGLQVVEYPGASVVTGTTTNMNTTSLTLAQAPSVDQSRSFLLLSSRSGDEPVCARALRASLNAAGTVTFSRGAGNGACTATVDEVAYQRVELPAGNVVQQVTFNLAAAATSATQPISPVDLTRTAIFSGGMMTSGTAWGESALASGELFGEALGRHALTGPTGAEVRRDSASAAAVFTGFVIQFQP